MEMMTRGAKKCFDEAAARGEKPSVCSDKLSRDRSVDMSWLHDSKIRFYDVPALLRRLAGREARYPNLLQAVRWPDDPTRQSRSGSLGKFAANMLNGCERLADQNSSRIANLNNGLLCNSHFGEMQFLHAQASEIGEAPADTYFRVQRWALFLFDVASGRMSNHELDGKYCEYFAGRDQFNQAMLPSHDAIACEDVKDPAWRLTTLFTMRCSNPITSVGCYEEVGESRFGKARIYATGALLHLIQDSYSQAHCVRGECEPLSNRAGAVAKVECLPIEMFTTYRGQIGHRTADQPPYFAVSCNLDSNFDDPVTASAKALWHIANASSPDEFLADFYRVFGTAAMIHAHTQPAGLGSCFTGGVATLSKSEPIVE